MTWIFQGEDGAPPTLRMTTITTSVTAAATATTTTIRIEEEETAEEETVEAEVVKEETAEEESAKEEIVKVEIVKEEIVKVEIVKEEIVKEETAEEEFVGVDAQTLVLDLVLGLVPAPTLVAEVGTEIAIEILTIAMTIDLRMRDEIETIGHEIAATMIESIVVEGSALQLDHSRLEIDTTEIVVVVAVGEWIEIVVVEGMGVEENEKMIGEGVEVWRERTERTVQVPLLIRIQINTRREIKIMIMSTLMPTRKYKSHPSINNHRQRHNHVHLH